MGRKEIIETLFEVDPLSKDQFLKVKETLTRVGIASRKTQPPTLWQTCHVLHKQGKYYICHFKQLFQLDGRIDVTDFTDEDYSRAEFIVRLLEDWGLVRAKYEPNVGSEKHGLTILPHKNKSEWQLRAKYEIGRKMNGSKQED